MPHGGSILELLCIAVAHDYIVELLYIAVAHDYTL